MEKINLNNRFCIQLNETGIYLLEEYARKHNSIEWNKEALNNGYFIGHFYTLMKIFSSAFVNNLNPFENYYISMYDDHNWQIDEKTKKALKIKMFHFTLEDLVKVKINEKIYADLVKKRIILIKDVDGFVILTLYELIKYLGLYIPITAFPLESTNIDVVFSNIATKQAILTRKIV